MRFASLQLKPLDAPSVNAEIATEGRVMFGASLGEEHERIGLALVKPLGTSEPGVSPYGCDFGVPGGAASN